MLKVTDKLLELMTLQGWNVALLHEHGYLEDVGDLQGQANAWNQICEVLDRKVPKWHANGSTGKEAALATLRDMCTKADAYREYQRGRDDGWDSHKRLCIQNGTFLRSDCYTRVVEALNKVVPGWRRTAPCQDAAANTILGMRVVVDEALPKDTIQLRAPNGFVELHVEGIGHCELSVTSDGKLHMLAATVKDIISKSCLPRPTLLSEAVRKAFYELAPSEEAFSDAYKMARDEFANVAHEQSTDADFNAYIGSRMRDLLIGELRNSVPVPKR